MNVSHPVPSSFHLCTSSNQDTSHVICIPHQKDSFCFAAADFFSCSAWRTHAWCSIKVKTCVIIPATYTHTHILLPCACRESVQYYHRSTSSLCPPPASESLLWGSTSFIFACIFIFNIYMIVMYQIKDDFLHE